MKLITFAFLIVIACLCMTFSEGSYEDCCLKYTKFRPSMQKMVRRYRVQQLDGGCNIPAVVFTMKRGKKFCADPKAAWVLKLMKQINMHKKAIKG